MARRGVNIVAASLHEENASATAREAQALGVSAIAASVDVTNLDSVMSLADLGFGEFGAVDFVFNIAGVRKSIPFFELTQEDWIQELSVHLGGTINSLIAFLPRLREQPAESHIVNMSSMAGIGLAELRANKAPYATAKAAVITLTETMAPTLAEYGIGVSVVCAGLTMEDPSRPTVIMGRTVDILDEVVFPPSQTWSRDNILTPDQLAQEVICAIEEGRLYVFPHRSGQPEVEERFRRVLEGFEQAARTSPPLSG